MTPSEKQALRALCEKAPDAIELVMRGSGYLSYQDPSDEAKAFYQRARSALPELLDECERLERERALLLRLWEAARDWKRAADNPEAEVWKFTERLDAAIDRVTDAMSPRRG